MSDEFLGDRRKALEESFFAKQEHELLAKLRGEREGSEKQGQLSRASGIRDEAVLESLLSHGVEADTLAALSLFPMVAVAWADGDVDESERAAILRAAEASGIESGDVSRAMLDHWLATRPAPAMFDAWKGYIGALVGTLDATQRNALRDEILGRAREVAKAAGGFLGIGSICAEEAEVLEELARIFG
ncbi:MAG: hypothetical protein MJE66_22255 [Proteobacteria bacterium]|nr:hypothetical protein [Pseudomonadota bacterium]